MLSLLLALVLVAPGWAQVTTELWKLDTTYTDVDGELQGNTEYHCVSTDVDGRMHVTGTYNTRGFFDGPFITEKEEAGVRYWSYLGLFGDKPQWTNPAGFNTGTSALNYNGDGTELNFQGVYMKELCLEAPEICWGDWVGTGSSLVTDQSPENIATKCLTSSGLTVEEQSNILIQGHYESEQGSYDVCYYEGGKVLASYVYNWTPEECQEVGFKCKNGFSNKGYLHEAQIYDSMTNTGGLLLGAFFDPTLKKKKPETTSPEMAKRSKVGTPNWYRVIKTSPDAVQELVGMYCKIDLSSDVPEDSTDNAVCGTEKYAYVSPTTEKKCKANYPEGYVFKGFKGKPATDADISLGEM